MINSLSGIVKAIQPKCITLEPKNTGIGFAVFVPYEAQIALGTEVELFTTLQWHQEQGPLLYGFLSELERTIFLCIISCSGIGPKIGLAVLEAMTPEDFLQAIMQEEVKSLSAISGIGKKKAEQMILSLKDKVAKLVEKGVVLSSDSKLKQWQQVSEVLGSLNYSRQEITQVLSHLKTSVDASLPFDQLLRKALSHLSRL